MQRWFLERLVAVRQNVEEIVGRGEVEPREGQTFRLQVLRQGFLAEGQLRLDDLQLLDESGHVRRLRRNHRQLISAAKEASLKGKAQYS